MVFLLYGKVYSKFKVCRCVCVDTCDTTGDFVKQHIEENFVSYLDRKQGNNNRT